MITTSGILRMLGPAIATTSPVEAFRAGLGAFLGLGVAGLFILSPSVDLRLGLYLIAPFGATSVLLFAVPNSPLAQPWSAVVGNMIAALIGVAVCLSIPDRAIAIAVAVALTITLTSLCRAVHPPAGAVAMTAAMNPDAMADLGFRFALTPVAAGTILLVVIATLYARATGRRYPFRQFEDPNTHGTADPSPVERLDLSKDELTGILEKYRQSFNLGVEDLARLIGAAEMQAATHRTGPLTATDIMSRDLVTARPDDSLSQVAEQFRQHRFTALPVVQNKDEYLGVIFQMHLISKGQDEALRQDHRFAKAMARLLRRDRTTPIRAREIMDTNLPHANPNTPVAALLPLMAEGDVDAVPVIEHERILGIVTRTDLIAALARSSLQNPALPDSGQQAPIRP